MSRSNELAVLLDGHHAATITRASDGKLSLAYTPEHLALPAPTPLSLSLPIQESSHSDKRVSMYLRGLLPDRSDVRLAWAQAAAAAWDETPAPRGAEDYFGLVRAIGLDTPGAALFTPVERLEDALARVGARTPVSEGQIASRLRALALDDTRWHRDHDSWSLAGAQSKFALGRTREGAWYQADGAAASTHILKPGIPHLPHQALTEHVTMRAAAALGLRVARTEFVVFEDQVAIAVERYDRAVGPGGEVARRHQEDLCQALGVSPDKKYAADGGPTPQQIASLLRAYGGERDVEDFARGLIANALLGAPDAHAKNYSILLAGDQIRLAPLYDVATGLLRSADGRFRYGRLAMSVGGANRIGEIGLSNWERCAAALGLPSGWVLSEVDRQLDLLPAALGAAVDALPADTPGLDEVRDELLPNIAHVTVLNHSNLSRRGTSTGHRSALDRLADERARTLPRTSMDPEPSALDTPHLSHGFEEPGLST